MTLQEPRTAHDARIAVSILAFLKTQAGAVAKLAIEHAVPARRSIRLRALRRLVREGAVRREGDNTPWRGGYRYRLQPESMRAEPENARRQELDKSLLTQAAREPENSRVPSALPTPPTDPPRPVVVLPPNGVLTSQRPCPHCQQTGHGFLVPGRRAWRCCHCGAYTVIED
jgi:hypothetical protein